eukprot:12337696-Ditylum_brightwellii.AAC.1
MVIGGGGRNLILHELQCGWQRGRNLGVHWKRYTSAEVPNGQTCFKNVTHVDSSVEFESICHTHSYAFNLYNVRRKLLCVLIKCTEVQSEEIYILGAQKVKAGQKDTQNAAMGEAVSKQILADKLLLSIRSLERIVSNIMLATKPPLAMMGDMLKNIKDEDGGTITFPP